MQPFVYPDPRTSKILESKGLPPLNPNPNRKVFEYTIPKKGEWSTDLDLALFIDRLMSQMYVHKTREYFYEPGDLAILSPFVMKQLREGRKCLRVIEDNKLAAKTIILMPVHENSHWKLTVVEGVGQAIVDARRGKKSTINIFEHNSQGEHTGKTFGKEQEDEHWQQTC